MLTAINSYFGAPGWTHHTHFTVGSDFEAISLLHPNVQDVDAIVTSSMAAPMRSLAEGLMPSGAWVEFPPGHVVPKAYGTPGVLFPTFSPGAEVEMASLLRGDGSRWRDVAVRTYRAAHYQPQLQPSGYTAAEWYAANPHTAIHSWVHGGNMATAATAGNGSGWTEYAGVWACGGIILRHAKQVAQVVAVGDSTQAGALVASPITNNQSMTWRAVRSLVEAGRELGYINVAISGSGWPRIKQQTQQLIATGRIGATTIATLQTHTVNSQYTPAQQWAACMECVALLEAAGARVVLIGPMLGNTTSQAVLDVRAMGLSQTARLYLDVSALIGRSDDRSRWAEGMAWDESHPSPAGMATLGAGLAPLIDQLIN